MKTKPTTMKLGKETLRSLEDGLQGIMGGLTASPQPTDFPTRCPCGSLVPSAACSNGCA